MRVIPTAVFMRQAKCIQTKIIAVFTIHYLQNQFTVNWTVKEQGENT